MTEYSKLTVANLKIILKDRAIPSTGLTRKQQIIDKLLEHDAQSQSNDGVQKAAVDESGTESLDVGSAQEKEQSTIIVEAQNSTKHAPTHQEAVGFHGQADASSAPDTLATANVPAATNQVRDETTETEPTSSVSERIPSQSAQTVEKSPPAPAPNAAHDPPEDGGAISDETRKRKRRSLTPSIEPDAVAAKRQKHKAADETDPLEEKRNANTPTSNNGILQTITRNDVNSDSDHVDSVNNTHKETPDIVEDEAVDQVATDANRMEGIIQEPSKRDENDDPHHSSAINATPMNIEASGETLTKRVSKPVDQEPTKPQTSIDTSRRHSHSGKDNRYRELFTSTSSNAQSQELEEIQRQDEASDTIPALHPATSALYIRELKRPLRPEELRAHLVSLSTPPNTDLQHDESVLQHFYLDSIRSHCLVKFPGVKEASRVRNALHSRVWPVGRDRNPLWVDFVPEESLAEWIRTEEEAAAKGGRFGGKKWEVIYQTEEDGDTRAVFQEVGPGGSIAPRGAPAGPRTTFTGPTRPPPQSAQVPVLEKQSKAFQSLDELFKSTSAKPKLYYLPVSQELADKRQDEFDRLIDRDTPHHGDRVEEYRRFTYEDGNILVDAGPDSGPRSGAPGRGRGNGYRGGYRTGPRLYDRGYRGDRYRSDDAGQRTFGQDRRGFHGR